MGAAGWVLLGVGVLLVLGNLVIYLPHMPQAGACRRQLRRLPRAQRRALTRHVRHGEHPVGDDDSDAELVAASMWDQRGAALNNLGLAFLLLSLVVQSPTLSAGRPLWSDYLLLVSLVCAGAGVLLDGRNAVAGRRYLTRVDKPDAAVMGGQG